MLDYLQQLRLERYQKTPEYQLEKYLNALYECGEALV